MCDNPKKNPWEVLVRPELVRIILQDLLDKVIKRGIEDIQKEIPALKEVPKEELVIFLKGIERKEAAIEGISERDLAHVDFDIERLKKLSDAELKELLGNKLVPRIIEDIKKLEAERPIPDWCYAFF